MAVLAVAAPRSLIGDAASGAGVAGGAIGGGAEGGFELHGVALLEHQRHLITTAGRVAVGADAKGVGVARKRVDIGIHQRHLADAGVAVVAVGLRPEWGGRLQIEKPRMGELALDEHLGAKGGIHHRQEQIGRVGVGKVAAGGARVERLGRADGPLLIGGHLLGPDQAEVDDAVIVAFGQKRGWQLRRDLTIQPVADVTLKLIGEALRLCGEHGAIGKVGVRRRLGGEPGVIDPAGIAAKEQGRQRGKNNQSGHGEPPLSRCRAT